MKKTKLFEFEVACTYLGLEPEGLLAAAAGLPEWLRKSTTAFIKLNVIQQAVNDKDGFTPDFSDKNQYKYTAWLVWSPSVGGFVFTNTGYTDTFTNLGARFWFKDGNTASEFFARNPELHNDILPSFPHAVAEK
jgi:hypothetical protein